MKKFAALSLTALIAAGSLQAHGYNYYYPRAHVYYGGHGGGWVAPLIVGGMLGYALSRPNVVYTQPAPTVIYTQPSPQPVIVESYPGTTAVQQSAQIIEQTPVYEERIVYFDDCKCERKVLVNIRP